MLQKRNKNKIVYYSKGEVLSFYRHGSRSKITDEIVAFEDSLIVFNGYKVHVGSITALHIDHKTRWWLRYKAGQLLLIGGTTYLILDVLNSGEISPETLTISGISIGAGLIAKLFIRNKIRIHRKTKLRIIHL